MKNPLTMRRPLPITEKVPVLVLIALLFVSSAAEASKGVCGVFESVGAGTQLIPKVGRILNRIPPEAVLPCGAMVMTRKDATRIRLSDRSTVKIAPGSFIEIREGVVRNLYRGEILLSGPATQQVSVWSTPNSNVEFKGGLSWIQYVPDERKSSVAVFNREVLFSNRFNREATRQVRAGETSRLLIQEALVKPSFPEIMSHASVAPLLTRFGLAPEEMKELVRIVKQVHESRSTALASEIEEWNEESDPEESRAPASVSSKEKTALDEREAQFVLARLRDRVFGKSDEIARVENDRRPASRPVPPVFSDEEYREAGSRKRSELRRLTRQLDGLRTGPDQEE